MIVEAFKIVSSIFPFIKESFLWRDGAEVGKPVTQANLRKRQAAVFVLLGSILLNYLSGSQLWSEYKKREELERALAQEQAAKKLTLVYPNNCISPSQVFQLVDQMVETEINQGILIRAGPKASKPLSKPTKKKASRDSVAESAS